MSKKRIALLNHTIHKFTYGGVPAQIVVLETDAAITPEDVAMLQALHSRSVGGIEEHLNTLVKHGSGKLMDIFYVGYGHKSIGDCGHITIFFEGVSMLVAKAIQDWSLYSGQESSTRYIDFAKQPFVDPVGSDYSQCVLERLRTFYLDGLEPVQEMFRTHYPYQNDWDQTSYEKTILARTFDVMRGFLPAGASTNLSWSSNLRQVADKLMLLRHHPLEEVRNIADALQDALMKHFPNSFGHKRYEKTEEYNKWWMSTKYYNTSKTTPDFRTCRNSIDEELLVGYYAEALKNRPPKTELPREIAECGTVQHEFLLDFASYRDIQRHRAIKQRMPLVTTHYGIHPWYMQNISVENRKFSIEASCIRDQWESVICKITDSDFEKQYYIPMGFMVPNRVTGDLHALTYLIELRATRFVHPTLRQRAFQLAQSLEEMFGKHGLKLYLDENPDAFDVKRGKQDIVEKK